MNTEAKQPLLLPYYVQKLIQINKLLVSHNKVI
jgi:hypothetical protein